MVDYAVAHLDEIEEIDDGRSPYRPVRHHLGITPSARRRGRPALPVTGSSTSTTRQRRERRALPRHARACCVRGRRDRVDAPAGTFVAAPPGEARRVAEEAGTTVVVVGAARDKPYEASGWEIGRRSMRATRRGVRRGRRASARDRCRASAVRLAVLQPRLLREPHRPDGRAVGHVRQAIELSEKFRTYARHDSDLDALRGDAAFQRLVGDDEAGGLPRVNEARLEETGSGLAPASDGWFVVNVRDTQWMTSETFGSGCVFESREHSFPEFGINLAVLQPGEPNCLYHAESQQESFLVLSGECRLLVNGEERALKPWDFVHCPAGTEHVFVGAGRGRRRS